MILVRLVASVAVFGVLALLGACASNDDELRGEHGGAHRGESRGEHGREGRGEHRGREGGGEHGREGGEESGTEFGLDDVYDNTRNGARLVLRYKRDSNSFVGTVQNTTKATLERVRVEVHLSNGKELGPTIPKNLAAGERIDVELMATSKNFDKWSAHPEVGSGEHGQGGRSEGHR